MRMKFSPALRQTFAVAIPCSENSPHADATQTQAGVATKSRWVRVRIARHTVSKTPCRGQHTPVSPRTPRPVRRSRKIRYTDRPYPTRRQIPAPNIPRNRLRKQTRSKYTPKPAHVPLRTACIPLPDRAFLRDRVRKSLKVFILSRLFAYLDIIQLGIPEYLYTITELLPAGSEIFVYSTASSVNSPQPY